LPVRNQPGAAASIFCNLHRPDLVFLGGRAGSWAGALIKAILQQFMEFSIFLLTRR
jgi:hypothetical protein